jgi:hypothetical protein
MKMKVHFTRMGILEEELNYESGALAAFSGQSREISVNMRRERNK